MEAKQGGQHPKHKLSREARGWASQFDWQSNLSEFKVYPLFRFLYEYNLFYNRLRRAIIDPFLIPDWISSELSVFSSASYHRWRQSISFSGSNDNGLVFSSAENYVFWSFSHFTRFDPPSSSIFLILFLYLHCRIYIWIFLHLALLRTWVFTCSSGKSMKSK